MALTPEDKNWIHDEMEGVKQTVVENKVNVRWHSVMFGMIWAAILTLFGTRS